MNVIFEKPAGNNLLLETPYRSHLRRLSLMAQDLSFVLNGELT